MDEETVKIVIEMRIIHLFHDMNSIPYPLFLNDRYKLAHLFVMRLRRKLQNYLIGFMVFERVFRRQNFMRLCRRVILQHLLCHHMFWHALPFIFRAQMLLGNHPAQSRQFFLRTLYRLAPFEYCWVHEIYCNISRTHFDVDVNFESVKSFRQDLAQ